MASGEKAAPQQDAPAPGAEDPMTNTVNVGPMLGRIAGEGAKGAAEGFGSEPLGLSPQTEEGLVKAGVYNAPDEYNPLKGLNKAIIGGVSAAGDLALRAGNALFRGAQGVVAQTGAEVGAPQLGRDIAAIPEAFMGSPDMLSHGAKPATITARQVQARDGIGVMEAWQRAHAENTAADIAAIGKAPDIDSAIAAAGKAAQAPDAASVYGVAPDFVPPATDPLKLPRILALLNEDDRVAANRPTFVPPDAAQPSIPVNGGDLFAPKSAGNPAAEAPAPQSVGAAASRDMTRPDLADISDTDMKANRRRAEMDEILAPPQANDTTIHVDGSFPTLAESSADPLVSQYENLLRQRKPDEFIGDGKRLTENNKARVGAYDDITVPDTTLNTMRKDRSARWAAASDDILPKARPADLTPALDWVQEQLDNPRIQENDAVRSVLENFRDRLVDNGGNLKTDPAAVWGIHDNLQNQLAKAKDPLNMTGAEKFAEAQILMAKSLIDKAMNVATDNKFQSALDGYAEDSKAINSGMLLNDFRPKLTNMSGELQAANFHRFVANLAKERGDPGIDPSMDISDQTMRSLINIDTDLKRAGLIKLGSAAGSPTNLLGALAESAGLDAAHSALHAVPAIGPILSVGQKYLANRKLQQDTAKHLAPPEGGYRFPLRGTP